MNDRVASVQNAITQISPRGAPVPIYASNLGAGSWMGEDADATQRDVAKTRPEPRLPLPPSKGPATAFAKVASVTV